MYCISGKFVNAISRGRCGSIFGNPWQTKCLFKIAKFQCLSNVPLGHLNSCVRIYTQMYANTHMRIHARTHTHTHERIYTAHAENRDL